MPLLKYPRLNVLGVGVHAIAIQDALEAIAGTVSARQKGYICVTGVHGVMEAQGNPAFRAILNRSLLTVPDGMPLVWLGRWLGFSTMDRVYGPDLMSAICRWSVSRRYTHFFYGGKAGVAETLKRKLEARFPGLQVVGTHTPPFRPLDERERRDLLEKIDRLRPTFFWVGLSTPKQEWFMAEFLPKLDTRVMLGVGAAFDVHTGGIRDAPDWVKRAGLQWLHRLAQEPRRLYKRYLINNPKFVWMIARQFFSGSYRFESQVQRDCRPASGPGSLAL